MMTSYVQLKTIPKSTQDSPNTIDTLNSLWSVTHEHVVVNVKVEIFEKFCQTKFTLKHDQWQCINQKLKY